MKKIGLLFALAILTVSGIFAIFLLSGTHKPAAYKITGGNLVIQGSYGVTIPLMGITSLQLTDSLPSVGANTYQSVRLGTLYQGEFLLRDSIHARLYVDHAVPPFIRFQQGGTVYYINTSTPDGTRNLFRQLQAAVK